jgi:hypothetical protein
MVSAARSKVSAVSKYPLPRREIWIVMKPSRGSRFVVALEKFSFFPTRAGYGDHDQRLN